jgi:hypothetical protein
MAKVKKIKGTAKVKNKYWHGGKMARQKTKK